MLRERTRRPLYLIALGGLIAAAVSLIAPPPAASAADCAAPTYKCPPVASR